MQRSTTVGLVTLAVAAVAATWWRLPLSPNPDSGKPALDPIEEPSEPQAPSEALPPGPDLGVVEAFREAGLELTPQQLVRIQPKLDNAKAALCGARPGGSSKVGVAAVEIAALLDLEPKTDRRIVGRITRVLNRLGPVKFCRAEAASWQSYFTDTVSLMRDRPFLELVGKRSFSPVKISWEDIGRTPGSSWGDRISDVGIWVRRDETDPESAELALSVRRDNNFRDKVLVVPAEKIKVHLKRRGQTEERTLPERLQELGLRSKRNDDNVIVSNQFAIVPVPAKTMQGSWPEGEAPRAAFNFSIFPYGSTNFVITDVIEGSSNAIVGPGGHQLLYANIDGQKAPFTASRAAERPDLLALERKLKAKGMDVDVQRYYLIQIPLKPGRSLELSNMGTPPLRRYESFGGLGSGAGMVVLEDSMDAEQFAAEADGALPPAAPAMMKSAGRRSRAPTRGLTKVAIGHGDTEGAYREGSGFRGQRAEAPIRVTVVYFVTPQSKVTEADMKAFAKAFEAWDSQALWGGSFVVPE